ncbi:MAG: hypothetical protein WAW88_15330 [Nocardioides sp.]
MSTNTSVAARLVTLVTGAGLALSLGAVPAQARTAEAMARPAAAPSASKALPLRNLNDKLVRRGGKLIMHGKVRPAYKRKIIVIQRAKCDGCTFRKVDRVRTNSRSVFNYRMSAPRSGSWYYRAFAKKQGGYAKSWTNYVYQTYRA